MQLCFKIWGSDSEAVATDCWDSIKKSDLIEIGFLDKLGAKDVEKCIFEIEETKDSGRSRSLLNYLSKNNIDFRKDNFKNLKSQEWLPLDKVISIFMKSCPCLISHLN